jgi:hypothetical protein
MATISIPPNLKEQLEKNGYSENTIDELWKWYDSSAKKGVASF